MPDPELNALHASSYSILIISPKGSHALFHFTCEETEVQRWSHSCASGHTAEDPGLSKLVFSQATLGNVWRHFQLSQLSQGGPWHLVGRVQICSWTSYSAQDSPYPQQRLTQPTMSIVPMGRNPTPKTLHSPGLERLPTVCVPLTVGVSISFGCWDLGAAKWQLEEALITSTLDEGMGTQRCTSSKS